MDDAKTLPDHMPNSATEAPMTFARAAARSHLFPPAVALLLAAIINSVLPEPATVPLFTMVIVMAVAVALCHRRFAPDKPFGIANSLTLLRAVLICAMVASLWVVDPSATVETNQAGLAGLALLLDWMDGRAARLFQKQSPFGARFDVEIDSLFLVAASMILIDRELIGIWVLLLPAARPLFAGAGLLAPELRHPLPATRRRSACAGLSGLILVFALMPGAAPVAAWLVLAALAVTLVSFALDLAWLARRRSVEAATTARMEHERDG